MEKLRKNSGRNEEEEDRLSARPEELIHRILAFGVGLNEVVQTCVLSKRWVNIWSTFPYLNLKWRPLSHENDVIVYRNNARYCNFITKFLLNRNRHSGTCSVAIDFQPFDQCVRGMVLSILSHAVSHSVRHIYFYNTEIDSYLSFPALRTLLLNQCEVSLTKWSLPCLTTLHLENVFLYGEDFSFKEFLCLNNLSLGECCTGAFSPTDPEVVRIDPPNLETFTIYQGNTMPPNCVFVVSAPKLKCFRLKGRYVPVFYGECGFPCLELIVFYIDIGNGEKVIFDPDIGMYIYDDYNLEENQVNEIMLKISSLFHEFGQTKVLTLFLGTIQVLSRVQDFSKYQLSPFLNLNSLYLIDYVPAGPPTTNI